jgi:His/Glu/Gln/Arg/opine family amino acid ABC transporter permease subunit
MLIIRSLLRIGLPLTLKLAFFSLLFTLMAGIVLGVIRNLKIPVVDQILGLYAQICRGVPGMIIMLFMYATIALSNSYAISILAIVFVEGAYMMEIVKGGFRSIDKGQWEAAKSLSLPMPVALLQIIIPQVFLTILPAIMGQAVMLIKGTAIASTIGCLELTRQAQFFLPRYPYPMIIYGYVLIIYFVICHMLTMLGTKFEKSIVRRIIGEKHE